MEEGTGIPRGAVGRLLHDMTIGTIEAVREKDRSDGQTQFREFDQQFQVAISGTAGAVPIFEPVTVNFDYPFYFAPAQRESSLDYPHFTYGSHSNPPVGVMATVSEWLHDEGNGAIIGAVVHIGAVGEGEFEGFAHLNFQGYGGLAEEDQVALVEGG